jgi:tetratricopeptide (TPR) repeat protein
MKNRYITLIFILVIANTQAQNNNTKTADKFFDRFEYVNATRAYLQLTNTAKGDNYVYKKLADCYYYVFNSVEAEKWYEKAVQKEQDAETYFRYAQMLKANSKYDESNMQMKKFASLSPNDKRAKNIENEKNYLNALLGSNKMFEVALAGINSKNSDFGAYLKNNIVYFASARNTARKNYEWNNQPFLDLYQAGYTEGKLTEKVTPVSSLNSKYHEGPLCVTTDGNTAYFSRESYYENEFEKAKDKKSKLGKMFIYKATNDNGKWVDITAINLNNKLYNTSSPSLSKDGKTLYFISDRPGTLGKTDVWKAVLNTDGSFGEPQNLGSNVNTEGNELSAFIADDSKETRIRWFRHFYF